MATSADAGDCIDAKLLLEVLLTARDGDFSVRLPVDWTGVNGKIADTFNEIMALNQRMATELARVSRVVGQEGKINQRASLGRVGGMWAEQIEEVNMLIKDLTWPVSETTRVIGAVAKGDLSQSIPLEMDEHPLAGEFLRTAKTVNTMVDQLNGFTSEVTRVAREVGTEGKLGGQANVKGAAGIWKDLTDSVNLMASNLTGQVRNIADVTTAVANGDLSKKITVDVRGEFLQLKDTINTMVDQLRSFASEVTRVAREVGTEGKLGGQANVPGVGGVWKDLTDNVNSMASNLTGQVRNIAEVTTAVASGNLSRKITAEAKGEILELKNTINTMVDQLSAFASEVNRVAREVGTDGKLGGQANVPGVAGVWKDLTDNVNSMASNLTGQVRNIAEVTIAVANGDLSKKITVDVRGEFLQLKDTINTMVDQLRSFASEVTRVAREVGTDGRLGGQATVPGVAGVWKDLTDNVNSMASNLTGQVRNIAEVTTAVANGDLSKKITVDVRGELLQLKDTINTMVDQLNGFASEVTRVAREVGTEGKLGGQAEVQGVSGTWKDLTDSVNFMAANLTGQVRNIALVTTAVANGDLSKKVTVNGQGEILELKDTINIMVDQLNGFASEVTRVAREVGTEGKLGGQAEVKGVSGTWKDLTDSVNFMGSNLTDQVRNIALVTTAVAYGDLSKKITVDARGEILELKDTINTMVDQLSGFASEVTRVAREVGTEGKLGGQADVKGVSGTWKDLTDNVNSMASNLTNQVRNIARVTTAVANGDLTRKITVDARGEILELKDTINTMVDQLNGFASEVTRVAREVGTEGKLGGQAQVIGVGGTWKDLTESVNFMAANLTGQVRNIADVTTAVARGDLTRKITVDARGEIQELKNTINIMVDQLNAFASEMTRVAREVGTEGKLGGQADVRGISGTWKDLTDSVNLLANNLTIQVRNIAVVVTAVANGNLKLKLTVQAKGEIAELAETINNMIDTLSTFADQVTSVAREVGVEGKLGGQANVPGAAGTWKDLTDNVNQLAANLSTQVRAIAEVATAVTKGDLTRSIKVETRGEMLELKDNINEMIRNLRETMRQNTEQDWLKTNLAKFTRLLQGQRNMLSVARTLLSELSPLVGAAHSVFYILDSSDNTPRLKLLASYGYKERKNLSTDWKVGEGLVGQCAYEKQRILLTNVPADYVQITSGLGQGTPLSIVVLPILFEGQVKAVVEMASFERYSPIHQTFLEQLTESIGIVLNTIEAGMRTEDLLKQSQSLAEELQSQQQELRQTNEELEEKARMLTEQKAEVERKNREIDEARRSLEEKAEQLALTSRYKSEFLANMSHELRTPLNSLLLLSQQLADNPQGNLTKKQVDYAAIIRASGNDLLNLINDILDLSKIESGTVVVEIEARDMVDLVEYVESAFRPVAQARGLSFDIDLSPDLPRKIETDIRRLQQVLKNLLSNAFKFTEKGGVTFSITQALRGWNPDNDLLNSSRTVIAFSIKDTGIGIPPEKQKIIFESFQQVDGSTSRKYGGTGLGLSISRAIAYMLGGEITVNSQPGEGSTFTLFVPLTYAGPHRIYRSENGIEFRPAIQPRYLKSDTNKLEANIKQAASNASAQPKSLQVPDDRETIHAGDRVVLIVEDDAGFASLLQEMAEERGFKTLITASGAEAIRLAKEYPVTAITLDILLPDMDGWTVLDRMKQDPEMLHVPVHIISVDDSQQVGLEHGAFTYLTKPVSRESLEATFQKIQEMSDKRIRKLLLVDQTEEAIKAMIDLIGNEDLEVKTACSGEEALQILSADQFDCVVLGVQLEDMSGFNMIEKLHQGSAGKSTPVIIYSQNPLTSEDENHIKNLSKNYVVKTCTSPERLIRESALFLHRVMANMPEARQRTIKHIYESDAPLADRKILIVDDDVRNLFALTAVLEQHHMNIITAETGSEAIRTLAQTPGIDLVLMDIMMPEMDGYATIQEVRKDPQFKMLPIIALTAKAMKGDREKCLEAGASDYIAKPVEINQLLSLLRVWLFR